MGKRGVAIKLEKEGGDDAAGCLPGEKGGGGKRQSWKKNQNSVKRMRRGETALVLAEEKEEKEAVAGDDGDRGERGREARPGAREMGDGGGEASAGSRHTWWRLRGPCSYEEAAAEAGE